MRGEEYIGKNRTAGSPLHTAKHAKSYRSSECEIRNLEENPITYCISTLCISVAAGEQIE